jgi:spore maturation protein CgeB
MVAAIQANPSSHRAARVLVVGPIYGGTIETARSTARASEALGAETRLLDFDPFGAGWHALSALPMTAPHKTQLRIEYAKVLAEAVVASALEFRPDLVIALAQAPLNASVTNRLRAAGIRTAFWFVENHRVLPYWKQVAKDYDAFFAMQDEPFLSMLREAGAPKAIYLPTAADPDRHVPIELTEAERRRFGAEVSFAGAPYLNRQRMLLGLIDLAPRIWGEGWAGTEVARLAAERGARFDLFEMIRIFAGTKINLNIHSANHVAGLDPDPDYVNPRTFELAACGAFQLVDARAPLATMFRDDEIVTFRSMGELRQQIARYLAHPEERTAIAGRARARVLAEHTFVHRVRRIFEEMLPPELQPGRKAAGRGLAEAIAALERTSSRMTPDEAMMRVLQHVQQGKL